MTGTMSLTSAHAAAAALGGRVPALAQRAAVGRPRVGAVAEAPVHALRRARRPRRPLGPPARGRCKGRGFSFK